MPVVSCPSELVADFQAQRAGDATAGVAGHEQVVVAFVRIGIAHQAALGADRLELRITTGDELMRINLVAGVPDQAVLAEIEGQVQGEAQFDDAEIAGEVGRPNAQHTDQLVAHFLSQLYQLVIVQPVEILAETKSSAAVRHAQRRKENSVGLMLQTNLRVSTRGL